MAKTYKTPGVYVEEIASFPPSIAEVETAIPAFIGFTAQALDGSQDVTGIPVRISSLLEYEQVFGEAQPEENLVVTQSTINGAIRYTADFDWSDGKGPSKHIMYYAIQQFYENGGGPAYIVSTGPYLALGGPIADISKFGPAIDELKKVDEVTLLIIVEGQNMPTASYQLLLQQALSQASALGDRFVILDLQKDGRNIRLQSDIETIASDFRDLATGEPEILRYGAAYFPNIRSSFPYSYDDTKVVIKIEGAADQHLSDLKSLDQANVTLALATFPIFLPPASSIAGIYARVDNNRGVWKAPANETVLAASSLTCDINDDIQDGLNVDADTGKSINAIRFFTGKGIKVWGARTLDGNSNEWRYVSVRRYFNMVEESTKKATSAFVFEPNDANTWTKVRAMIENFLTVQWRNGALAGAKPEQAFYVKVGLNQTMTAFDILEGRMIVEIGLAVVRPAEFIILRFSHKMQES